MMHDFIAKSKLKKFMLLDIFKMGFKGLLIFFYLAQIAYGIGKKKVTN